MKRVSRAVWFLFFGSVYVWTVGAVDPFVLKIIVYGAALFGVVPALLFTGVAVFSRLMRMGWEDIRTSVACVGVGGALLGLAVPVNTVLCGYAVETAKAYPAQIEGALEEYRRKNGVYPKEIEDLPAVPKLPRLLRPNGYQNDGKSYWFYFPKPGGLIDVWVYEPRTRNWTLSD